MKPHRAILLAAGLLCLLGGSRAFSGEDLEALRELMGDIVSVRLDHETKMTEPTDGAPPRRSDAWHFTTGAKALTVRYSRFLNQPPHYTGNYPSLRGGDMGVGFDGDSLGYWYRGNAIRVLVNGNDIMSARPASEIEAEEGDSGRVRMVWSMENDAELVLTFVIPESGRGIYAGVELLPAEMTIETVELHLTCYPGGFGPAYGRPSNRWVVTSQGDWEVPKEYEKPFPQVPIEPGQDWLFYADKLSSRGSLGLLLGKGEAPSGTVRMSNYGQKTILTYPPDTREIHLAFYAFEIENKTALTMFKSWLEHERAKLESVFE